MVPPAPAGLRRTIDDEPSTAARNEHEATAIVSASYRDDDDAVLDDRTVRLFRFQDAAAPRQILVDILNNIEFDSGRVGIGVLADNVGIVAAAPQREQATDLLTASPVITDSCLETAVVLPTRTRTADDDTPRQTTGE
ncbi:hypothetical protein [Halosegnis sp.]|uniref:hypothetical protein n=1 Tax=Halosegnis sp. TaxID=2864959 RepID=UPI0035D524DC